MTCSADFSSIHTKLLSKDIRIRGLKPINLPDLGSDSDDEDFDVNSAHEDQIEDGEYHQGANEEDEMSSETSDTDEVMKELEPESDNAMEEEERDEVRDNDQDNPSVRQKEGLECRNDRRWESRHSVCYDAIVFMEWCQVDRHFFVFTENHSNTSFDVDTETLFCVPRLFNGTR